MRPRDRLLTSLQHREPDRVPVDFGGTGVTTMCKGAYRDLMAYLGRDPEPIAVRTIDEQTVRIDEKVLVEVFRSDTREVRPRVEYIWDQHSMQDEGDYLTYTSEWQTRLRMPKIGGHYFDIVARPLEKPSLDAVNAYSWPNVANPLLYEDLDKDVRLLYDASPYALVAWPLWGIDFLNFSQAVRGMEAFLVDMVAEPAFADGLMERVADVMIAACCSFLDKVGPLVQVVALSTDLGTQQGPLLSPTMYRARIKPLHKRIIEAIKSRSDAYIFFHTCGASREFFPDLIELGVDIVNPIQVGASGMSDTAELKRLYGKDLTLWGGVCDSQHVLPFGTPGEVRDETRRRLDDLMPDGGFVAAPIHNIQDGVPPENVIAMIETIHEHGVY